MDRPRCLLSGKRKSWDHRAKHPRRVFLEAQGSRALFRIFLTKNECWGSEGGRVEPVASAFCFCSSARSSGSSFTLLAHMGGVSRALRSQRPEIEMGRRWGRRLGFSLDMRKTTNRNLHRDALLPSQCAYMCGASSIRVRARKELRAALRVSILALGVGWLSLASCHHRQHHPLTVIRPMVRSM